MRIKCVIKSQSGCCLHRIASPLSHMPFRSEDTLEMGEYGNLISEDPGNCSIYCFNRDVTMSPEKLLQLKNERGFLIWQDIDDFWQLYPGHYMKQWWGEDGKYVKSMIAFMKIADIITCTNERLREKILPYNPNVKVYPNCVEPQIINREPSDKMRFIYVAGITHEHDCKLLENAFKRIGNEPHLNRQSEYILAGFDTKTPSATWDRMMATFTFTNSFQIWGNLPLTEYLTHYDLADVALVPLVTNEFNSCKSLLKINEAASKGMPCIVSDTSPYNSLRGVQGLMFFSNTTELLSHIRYCTKNHNFVKDKGMELKEYMAKNYDIKYWSALRYVDMHNLLVKHGNNITQSEQIKYSAETYKPI